MLANGEAKFELKSQICHDEWN